MSHLVAGEYASHLQPVIDAFADHLRSTPWGGASLAVFQDGVPVIDVWGGIADVSTGRAWSRDTTTLMYSCSKSVSAIVVLRLVEQGLIDLDAPVAIYWPDFAQHGKGEATVRDVMSHRAGVPLVDTTLTLDEILDGRALVDALAAQPPLWEPGHAHAYHAITVGTLLGEIVLRATGKSLGTVLRQDLAEPLDLDLWIGLPEAEQQRTALILPSDVTAVPAETVDLVRAILEEDDRALRALTLNGAIPIPLPGVTLQNAWNLPELRAAEFPAGNAVSTARSLAKLHAALVGPIPDSAGTDNQPLLTEETLDDATRPLSSGPQVIGPHIPPYAVWGSAFMLPSDLRPMLGPTSFGHDGAAGALCFADRESRVGFAFLPSVFGNAPDARVNILVDELKRCLSDASAP
jgi:CubicO group peptidase (beta-lactamase class C family)